MIARGRWKIYINVMRTRRSQSSSDPVLSSEPEHGSKTHPPVLLQEAIDSLDIHEGDVVVDATLGGAGHAKKIAERLDTKGVLIGFDLDEEAIVRAKEALAETKPTVHLIQANFRNLSDEITKLGIPLITKALFDLGWSGFQLKAGRGFSFLADEPLSMTYSKSGSGLTASTIVNEWGEESLADIIFGWGEERYSRRIAKAIVTRREKAPFKTSAELGDAIKAAVPVAYRRGRIHPATRTFQALRIAVNDEIGALKEGLEAAWNTLAPGGRIAVITFHSVEDRVVKRLFAEWEKEGSGQKLSKKPIGPSVEEIARNPRSRSAKLRAIQKNTN